MRRNKKGRKEEKKGKIKRNRRDVRGRVGNGLRGEEK